MIAGLAALPAAVQAATAEPDPIFSAIDAYRRADAACNAVEGDIPDDVGGQWSDAYSMVLRTRPTTPAGLAALTTWAREKADWLHTQGSIMTGESLCALTATIDDATRGMSGLNAWTPPAAAAAQPDLVYAAIERYRQLSAEHDTAAGRSCSVGRDDPDYFECQDRTACACTALFKQMDVIFAFRPSTVAGVAALLNYISTLAEWQMPLGLEGEGKEKAQALCVSLRRPSSRSGVQHERQSKEDPHKARHDSPTQCGPSPCRASENASGPFID